MQLSQPTKQAISHTLHCLTGCSIGEVLGMAIAASLHWHRFDRVAMATALAFLFGYGLTFWGARKKEIPAKDATKLALTVDTISITSMELIDNTIEFLIPKALTVTLVSFRFWWGLALSLSIAFIVTVPVNRFVLARGGSNHDMHHH